MTSNLVYSARKVNAAGGCYGSMAVWQHWVPPPLKPHLPSTKLRFGVWTKRQFAWPGPISQIVREAIREYHSRMDRLTEQERDSMLRAFDELAPAIPGRGGSVLSLR